MDEALKRTTAAVERYRPPERMIAVAQRSLVGRDTEQRVCLEANALGDAVLEIAEAHGGVHENCATCVAIINGLAVTMGILRAEVEVEFAAKLGE